MKTVKQYTCKWIAIRLFAALFFFTIISSCKAQSTPQQALLALSKRNHTLAIVDPATLKVVARIPVGEDPHEVSPSADGKTAYVSIYGGGSLHTLNVIDLVAQKPATDIDTRPLWGPHGLAVADGKIWFTVEGSKAIGRYDPSTSQLDWSMGTGQDRTHMIYVTNGAKKIYTTNVASGTVSILQDTLLPFGNGAPPKNAAPRGNMSPPPQGNFPLPGGGQPRANWVQTIIPVSKGSEGFDVSPDSSELWTASAEDGTLFIIDVKAKKVTAKIDAKVNGANRLKFTPDGKLVFISSLGSGNLSVFDAKTHELVKQIPIGHGAAGIVMQPDGARAYVACSPDDYVAVIDLKTLTVTDKIDVGGEPDGLAWAVR